MMGTILFGAWCMMVALVLPASLAWNAFEMRQMRRRMKVIPSSQELHDMVQHVDEAIERFTKATTFESRGVSLFRSTASTAAFTQDEPGRRT